MSAVDYVRSWSLLEWVFLLVGGVTLALAGPRVLSQLADQQAAEQRLGLVNNAVGRFDYYVPAPLLQDRAAEMQKYQQLHKDVQWMLTITIAAGLMVVIFLLRRAADAVRWRSGSYVLRRAKDGWGD